MPLTAADAFGDDFHDYFNAYANINHLMLADLGGYVVPVIEPVVSEEKLRQLLDEQHESEALDYKAELSLDDTRGLVEFAKDVGAMQVNGGFIVIGADNAGGCVAKIGSQV